jgi:hypothetical protein
MKTTLKQFKSERAAKQAYTRAENAWEAKRTEGFQALNTIRETMRRVMSMDTAEYESLTATHERCEKEALVLFEVMRAVYDAAKGQGFWIKSWHFGHNPTRDLIAANID